MSFDTTPWLTVAEDVLARSADSPMEHGAALRVLVEEAVPMVRQLQLLHQRFNEETRSEWRRKQIMEKRGAKNRYGWA